ncbi:MAG: PAS domain S-box protein [Anaerolineae bacterium]|nr:PAS domain S-box protein [Anaerolineae bacterium]MEB2287858.1 ATP-binding protein [Anaerolineae bacterium]
MFLLPDYRVRQRDHLLNISRAMTAQLDLGEVLRMVLQAATSMLSAEVGIIALRENGAFHTRAIIGFDPERASLFNGLLEELSALPTRNDEDTQQFHARMRSIARRMDPALRQVVALPMSVADDMLGIIFVFRSYAGAPTQNDYGLLQSFADQAAIAVHNARMYAVAIQERQRLAAILEHSADGVMILDAHLRIERWNRALSHMTGWQAAQASGRLHDDVIHWRRREIGPGLSEAIRQGWPGPARESGAPETIYVEGDLERLDGTSLSVGITYAALTDAQGALVNVIANVRDITHFREAERLKSTFISVVSHELKTPVALIKGYADALNRDDAEWDRATIQNGLTVIEEEADRLAELIQNLLEASKLQAESMKLTYDDVNLPALARRSIERFQTQTTQHMLSASFPDNFPIIRGDGRRLHQVLDNLLSNAIKYSPKGGPITVTGDFNGTTVRVSVRDRGTGLPPDQLGRVFERFYRVDNSLTQNAPGTGLGLYLVNAVIKAHGGRIWAENNPDGGATFSFLLPRGD